MAEKAWATPQEVGDVTGAVVDVPTVQRAQSAIETVSGVVVEAEQWDRLNPRDRRWLRNAVAYQAAFMVNAPDYFERMRLASDSVDGQSATYRADSIELAPMARKALRKLSWKGSRVVHLTAPTPGVDLDERDDKHDWKPL